MTHTLGVASLPAVFYLVGVVPPLLFAMGAWWIASTYVPFGALSDWWAGRSIVALAAGGVADYFLGVTATVTVPEEALRSSQVYDAERILFRVRSSGRLDESAPGLSAYGTLEMTRP